MGYDLAKQVWGIKLPPAEREVLRVLCDHANDKDIAWPSVERIAWFTDMSDRTVQRLLTKLVKAELIIPIAKTLGGRGNTVYYKIDLGKGEQKGECPKKWKNHDKLSEFVSDNDEESANNNRANSHAKTVNPVNLTSFSFNSNSTAVENRAILSSLSDSISDNVTPFSSDPTVETVTNQVFPSTNRANENTDRARKGDKSGFAYKEENHVKNKREEDPPVSHDSIFDDIKAIISTATGEYPMSKTNYQFEQQAIKIYQSAGANSVIELKAFVREEGGKRIRLNFIGSEFCSWLAQQKRGVNVRNGHPTQADHNAHKPGKIIC